MAEPDRLDEARFLREKQEYLDARLAYEQTLNRVGAGMPIPAVMEANYSVQSGGYERAATDPWIRESHPELAEAAARLAREEQEYLALDEPVSNHAQANCSIIDYTAAKFYEYAALAEMLYKLATDEAFRNAIATALGEAVESGGWLSDLAILIGAGFGGSQRAIAGAVNEDIAESNRQLNEAAQAAAARTADRISSYFSEKWQAFVKAWEECGLANAVAKTGIDGLFLAGEIVIGGVALKGVRFAYRLTREGLHKVDIISIDKGRSIGSQSWSTAALEGKYGKPQENQVGGVLPDRNNTIKDGPATEPRPDGQNGRSRDNDNSPAPAMRTKDELVPNGKVPSYSSGEFNSWWNDLSPEELDMLWKDRAIRNKIKAEVRSPGGLHEWLMTSMGPKLKELGFTMDEIKAMTTPTKEAAGPIPGTNERWRHTTDEGKTGEGAGRMHNALKKAIEDATDRNDLLSRLEEFSYGWLDDGPNSFPAPLRDLILDSH